MSLEPHTIHLQGSEHFAQMLCVYGLAIILIVQGACQRSFLGRFRIHLHLLRFLCQLILALYTFCHYLILLLYCSIFMLSDYCRPTSQPLSAWPSGYED